MDINTALDHIGQYLTIDSAQLDTYIQEDTIGGWHENEALRKWDVGSVWEIEGQILYALMRALTPKTPMAIGHYYGCSTAHLCEAIRRNRRGFLTVIEKDETRTLAKKHHRVAKIKHQDLFDTDYQGVDFVFEDALHTTDQVQHVWSQFVDHAPSGSVIVSHDSEHYIVGEQVRAGIEAAIGNSPYLSLLVAPGKCGLAIWRKP